MNIHFNAYQRAEPYLIYLGDVSGNIICALNGIRPDSVSFTQKLNNSYDLSFTVDRYIDVWGKRIESNGYHLLDEFMRIYVEQVGWFLMSAPSVSNNGASESLSVEAQSIEVELMHNDLRGLKINCGTSDSAEMLVAGNTILTDGVEFAKQQITFFNPQKPELSLLHIILRSAEVRGWSIGYVDEIPKVYKSYKDGEIVEKTVQLKDEIGRFEIDNQNVYAFLTQDLEQFFECILSFDIQNMTINAYRPENIGKDTNVTIGFRNLQNSNAISVDEDSIFTRYRVSGDDDLSIRSVNFGSDVIEDLSYFLNTRYLPESTIIKYHAWKSDLESKRYEYTEAVRTHNRQLNVLSELMDRVPLDDCSTEWNKFRDEELLKAKDNYTAQLKGYESFYTDEDGKFDEGKLAASSDANDYYQIRDVVLANINIELANRKLPTSVGAADYVKSWETDWKLYGVDELQIHMDFYQTELKQLKDAHFDLPYIEYMQNSEKDAKAFPPHTRDTHETQHALYLEYTVQLDEKTAGTCAHAYQERTTQYKAAEAILETYKKAMNTLAHAVNKETWRQEGIQPFTPEELTAISRLYKDTDYTNKNMFLTSFDDLVTQIDEELKLYQAACTDLEANSRPQYTYRTSLDNFLAQYDYQKFTQNLELGDFLYLAVTDEDIVKLRLVSCSFNPATMENDLDIEFSNMIQTKSKRYDISYLLNLGGGSSKNSASGSSHDYDKNDVLSITQGLLKKLLSSSQYANNVENLINQHFQSLIGQLVIAKGLEAEMIHATKISAEDGFFQYLQTALIAADKIVSSSGVFGKLSASVASIDGLLAGNISAELGHLIRLTAENATVDEAFIRDLIASQITVSMLKAGDITVSNHMRILSENGGLTMNGDALQIKGKKKNGEEYVAIQLGYSAAGKPALIICNETGAIMLDANGLHEAIIPDGLIHTNMIGKGQIQKDHLAFQTVETDKNGNIDASKVLVNGHGIQVEFSSITEEVSSVSTRTEELVTSVGSVTAKAEALTTSVDSVSAKAEKLETSVKSVSAKADELSSSVDSVSTKADALTTSVNNVSAKTDTLTKSVNTVTAKADTLATSVSNVTAKADTLATSVSNVTAKADTLATSVSNVTAKADTLTTSVSNVTAKTDKLETSVNSLENSSIFYTGEITSSNGTIFDKSGSITTTTLTAHVYKDSKELSQSAFTVKWYQNKDGGSWSLLSDKYSVSIPLAGFNTTSDVYFEFSLRS